MPDAPPGRDELWSMYLDQLPFEPYEVQENAILAWFETDDGVLVSAPTGMGKTLIAEAALFEALHTRQVAYYTTPLIALTDQKFHEMQDAAERWGFDKGDVGLVTGNRSINPDALVKVVVAEILLNRLLHPTDFDFNDVASVVMDEFHNFADPERGAVWELSLALLPKQVRLLLLSATVGNLPDFVVWLSKSHGRKITTVRSEERRVPLRYHWVGEELLNDHIEQMADGSADDAARRTPALVFCFNRTQCWSTAEQLRGKQLITSARQKELSRALDACDMSHGAGPALKQILLRGVGVHHAGLLPRYRRIVEELFQAKLLSVCVCTETLAAGINLPARSVVLTSLMKGPPGKKKLIEASAAHQMFGRAGRPQFDDEGHVYAVAHEDDVKIARWKEKYDQIPEDTKDPNLIRAKKRLKKKAPTRRSNEQYWNEQQFQKVIEAPPGKLYSKGELPWRLLAYLLEISPDVARLRDFVSKRLMEPGRREHAQKTLTRSMMTLWAGGYVELEPPPPESRDAAESQTNAATETDASEAAADSASDAESDAGATTGFGALLQEAVAETEDDVPSASKKKATRDDAGDAPERERYAPDVARPTPALDRLLLFKSVNPLYGDFLRKHLGIADENERLQALESVLEMTGSVAKFVKVPRIEELPPGPLAVTRLDPELIARGLVSAEQLAPKTGDERTWEERWTPTVGEKLRMLFDSEFPHSGYLRTQPVWVAGELLQMGGDFNTFVTSRRLTKQEGVIFRHLLRLILLCGEFAQAPPFDYPADVWEQEMRDVADQLTASCRAVDPESTDKVLESAAQAPDVVVGEAGEDGG